MGGVKVDKKKMFDGIQISDHQYKIPHESENEIIPPKIDNAPKNGATDLLHKEIPEEEFATPEKPLAKKGLEKFSDLQLTVKKPDFQSSKVRCISGDKSIESIRLSMLESIKKLKAQVPSIVKPSNDNATISFEPINL